MSSKSKKHTVQSQRLLIHTPAGSDVYYDIDPDGTVYWLRPARIMGSVVKIERRRVRDEKLIAIVKEQAVRAKAEQDVTD